MGPEQIAPPYLRKILPSQELARTLEALRRSPAGARRRVVQCHGCFDIVHPGHIRYLQFARSQGDILVVSITGDAAIDKGELRPYIPQELRAENLAALEFVDFVVVDEHPTAAELLAILRPDIYVKGQEYATSADAGFLAERDLVESYGGRVIYSSGQVVFSSTRLVESLGGSIPLEHARLTAICRRHQIELDDLSALIRRFRDLRVLVLGESIIERYVLCDAESIAAEAPMMALRQLDAEDYPGGAAFAALSSAALGADSVLVTALGEDAGSDYCRRTLDSFGVSVVPIQHKGAMSVHTRFLVDDRKLLKLHEESPTPLDSIEERTTIAILRDLCKHADVVIVHSRDGLISPALLDGFCREVRPSVSLLATFADICALPDGPRLSPHLAFTSERRLRNVMQGSTAGLSSVAHQFLVRSQAEKMLVTLEKRGVVTFERPTDDRRSSAWNGRLRSEYLPSLAHRVVDRLGVSTSMLMTAAMARAAGASLMQAAYLGEAVAAVGLASPGLTAVTGDEVLSYLGLRFEHARGAGLPREVADHSSSASPGGRHVAATL